MPLQARTLAFGLGLGTFLLYLPSLWFDFIQLDTRTILLNHPELYDEHSFVRSVVAIFSDFPREEPLVVRDLVWALQARLFGLNNPFGHHLGSVVLNALCTVIAFYWLWLTTRRLAFAAASSAWFAVLTVHVQPVCWTMGTKDLLVFAFMGLALITQRASLAHEGTPLGRRLWLGTLLVLVLAILSKFSAVFFFMVLGLHHVFLPHLDGARAPDAPLDLSRVRKVLPLLAAGAAISGVLYHWYNVNLSSVGVLTGRGPAATSSEHLHTLSQFLPWVLALNLKTLFWPFQYSILYQHPNANIPLSAVEVSVGYAVLVGLLALLALWLRKRKDLAFYLLSAGVLLLPYLNIQYIGYWVADRYLYGIALFAVAIVVRLGVGACERLPALARPLSVVFGLLLCAYAARTLQYQAHWRDEITLYRHETTLDRASVFAWQARAKEALRLAQASGDPMQRARLLEEARASSRRGLALYDALALPLSSYRASERLYASSLWVTLGDLAGAEGKPLRERVSFYERAYALAINAKAAMALAQAYLGLAGEERAPADQEALVRRSFSYFRDFVRQIRHDSARRQQAEAMLARNYEQRFPYLAPAAAALRAEYLQ